MKSSISVWGAFVDESLDGNWRKELRDFLLCHPLSGSAIECGGLEDSPCARTIDIASHLAPELLGRAGDKLQDQAASGAALRESQSKRHLHFFKELPPLRLRKSNDQPGEARQ
jgi:hypothetical protein